MNQTVLLAESVLVDDAAFDALLAVLRASFDASTVDSVKFILVRDADKCPATPSSQP